MRNDSSSRPRKGKRYPAHVLAQVATTAMQQGRISAMDRTVLLELAGQHGLHLDRRRGIVYRVIGSQIGRCHRTICSSTQRLRGAGLLGVHRRWKHDPRLGQTRQLPPLYSFPILQAPVPPEFLAALLGRQDRRDSESANAALINQPKRKPSDGAELRPIGEGLAAVVPRSPQAGRPPPALPPPAQGDPTSPGRITPAQIRAYADQLRHRKPADAPDKRKGNRSAN